MKTKEILAYLGAGVAAALTRFAFMSHAQDTPYGDPGGVRLIVMIVFFLVLVVIDRRALAGINQRRPPLVLDRADFAPKHTPQETADAMARVFAGVTDDASRRRAIGDSLTGILPTTVLVPFIFYGEFGTVGPLGWGLTVFFDVYLLLWAVGLYFRPRTEYHSPVRLRGDWLDRVGAFWLVGCAFGPFFGWIVTEAWPLTPGSWLWPYGLRAFLAAGLPVVLALPLLRYARGQSSLVALPLLLVITLLPVSTAVQSIQDLFEGPILRQVQSGPAGRSELYLKHTGRSLGG